MVRRALDQGPILLPIAVGKIADHRCGENFQSAMKMNEVIFDGAGAGPDCDEQGGAWKIL